MNYQKDYIDNGWNIKIRCSRCGKERREIEDWNGNLILKGRKMKNNATPNPADAPDTCYACIGAPGVDHTCGRSNVKKENQQLKEKLKNLTKIIEQVRLKSLVEEWPDCGKPYWHCELCGETTEKGEELIQLKHDKDCPIQLIESFLKIE